MSFLVGFFMGSALPVILYALLLRHWVRHDRLVIDAQALVIKDLEKFLDQATEEQLRELKLL